jgi:hypothetical protein
VPLAPKVAETLRVLLERHGTVVEKPPNRSPEKVRAVKKHLLFVLFLCGLQGAGSAQAQSQTHRARLKQPAQIQGYPCAKGYAWFFDDGRLNRCTVSVETAFGEARIPAGSFIALNSDGTPAFVQMAHNAPILGVTCLGGSWFGPSEGAMAGFYPSGKLKECYLAGDQTVQGVPCMNGGIFGDGLGLGAVFHETGKLKSCKLARDFGTWHKGDRFTQAP